MKPVFKLPAPALPKPTSADLLDISKIMLEAKDLGGVNWRQLQIKALIGNAHANLTKGNWTDAWEAIEKAAAKETKEKDGRTIARRYRQALQALTVKCNQHHSNGAALKVSLKAELLTKKESTHAPLLRQELQEANPSSHPHVPDSLENGQQGHAERGLPGVEPAKQERDRGESALTPVSVPEGEIRGRASGEVDAATSSPRTEPEPHPFAVAATKIELIKSYWGAIAEGVKADIILLTKQCKHVGLEEVYKETVWQLANRELHQAHRRARQVAVEAWEGMAE
jgi:hypothetical protein